MKQVVVIHGGWAFNSYEDYLSALRDWEYDPEYGHSKGRDWKWNLQEVLGEDYQVFVPTMPNKQNAKYAEWKIWFEKVLKHVNEEAVLVGHSQGGIFLAKYLSEERCPVRVLGTLLVAAPFDHNGDMYSVGDFALPRSLAQFAEQSPSLRLYFSKDDPIVPIEDLEQYQKALPSAEAIVFDDRGHFNQESFPEIAEDIRALR
jgi:predicted alpha/beta hydrolase family esterase